MRTTDGRSGAKKMRAHPSGLAQELHVTSARVCRVPSSAALVAVSVAVIAAGCMTSAWEAASICGCSGR